MLFNSLQFAIFFSVLLVLYRAFPRGSRAWLLLAASLLFYALWVPSYLLLMLADIGVNYALIRAIPTARRPRLVLAISVAFTLGLLAFFKYAMLLIETVLWLLPETLRGGVAVPDIFLPLGISFYSFQIIGFAVDTYRGRVEPSVSLPRFALFVSFFPQLIAGPILRGSELLPQLEQGGAPSAQRTRRGMWLIASGLAKKVVLADFLLAPFVDEVFGAPGLASVPFHWAALYSFAFQIYFDFSGYTDMARGLALLLGFELPLNFSEPYLSRNPAEFWRRWHITLSSWLRDYLYIPLGGNRRGAARTHANLLVTMLLGGLWHGAAWGFVLWGALHGLWLVVHRSVARSGLDAEARLRWRDAPRIFLCFHGVCLLWVFFRAPTFDDALLFLQGLAFGGAHAGWPVMPCCVVLLCVGLHPTERVVRRSLARWQGVAAQRWWGSTAEGLAFGAIVGLAIAVSGTGGEFIYFQF